ncbi:hypothetical protein VTH06DRAFT_4083 [Thermothelomyces fergusii]
MPGTTRGRTEGRERKRRGRKDADKSTPLLSDSDEEILQRLVSDAKGAAAASPAPSSHDARPGPGGRRTVARVAAGRPPIPTTATTTKKPGLLSLVFGRKQGTSETAAAVPPSTAADGGTAREKTGWVRWAALAATAKTRAPLQRSVVVLRDILRGALAAVDDLAALPDGCNKALKRGFEKLPPWLRGLVVRLRGKLAGQLPEMLAAGAQAHGVKKEHAARLRRFASLQTVKDLAVAPAVVRSLLWAIVNALRTPWPVFLGTSLLWSSAVVLLSVLWYFYKRGKEEREKLEKEAAER